MKISNRFGAALMLLAPVATLSWSGSSHAAATACLKGASLNKLCVDIDSVPGESVQPSGLAGTRTFIKYTADIRNLVAATSRTVSLSLTVSPAPASPMTFDADRGLECSVSGATLTCLADKLEGIDPLSVVLVAEAPQYPATVTQVDATGVIGWKGNTASTTQVVAVSNTAGDSYVPANTEVTLATSDNDEVTPESPLYARITLPPQPTDYRATIGIVGTAPANSNCVSGIYLTVLDGPYVCRDTAFPRRAIRVDVGEIVIGAADPATYLQKWDASIVPATQLPPTQVARTGTPPFAMFGAELSEGGQPATGYAALAALCGPDIGAPCLTRVERSTDGDWLAESRRITLNSETASKWSPLAPLQAVLDFIISRAEAQTIPTPRIGFGFMQ